MIGFRKPQDFERARHVLDAARYRSEGIDAVLGGAGWLTPRAIDLPRYDHLTRTEIPLHTLIRLLLLRLPVTEAAVCSALAPMALETWVEAGILESVGADGTVLSRLQMIPVEGLVLAADSPRLDRTDIPDDYVMGPGGSSLQLAWSALPTVSECTLDLGCGSGLAGLQASAFSRRVLATDINPRAIEITRFNALLNGCATLDARVGSLFEPVPGERFDLILSNPPFVITPESHLLLRDSGVRGDMFCKELLRQSSEFLREGGVCQMLANVPHHRQRPWMDEVASWCEDLGCDALVLNLRQQAIDDYAMMWIVATESQNPREVPAIFERWMAFYEQQAIEDMVYVLIILRRRDAGDTWCVVDREVTSIAGSCGAELTQRLATLAILHHLHDEADLLREHVRLNPTVRIVQEHAMTPDGPRVVANRLETRGGLRTSAQLDARVMRLLVCCDGQEPLGAILAGMADELGLTVDRVAQVAVPVVRHLLERGFLQLGHMSPDA